MKKQSLLLTALPALLLYNIGSTLFLSCIINKLTPNDQPTTIVYQKSIILAILLPAITHLIQFCHDVLTIGNSGGVPDLKKREGSNFDSFYFPILKEFLKILILNVLATIHSLNFKQIAIFVVISNSIQSIHYLKLFSSTFYQKDHEKFLSLYELWRNQDFYRNKFLTCDKDEIERLFKGIIEGEDQATRDSFSSSNSDDTLINTQKVSLSNLPPKFNFSITEIDDSFDAPKSPTKSLPIAKKGSEASSMNKKKRLGKYKSCNEFVEKLYSVSPKNTYHLNTASAIASFDSCSVDQEIQNDDSLEQDPLAKVAFTTENIDETGEDLPRNDALDTEHYILEEHPIDRVSSYTCHSNDSASTNQKFSTPNKLVDFINRFSWLFPPFLPIRIGKSTSRKSRSKETFPLLKQRLSTYNMNRAFSISSPSYGSLEEGGCGDRRHGGRSGSYASFKLFIAYYYDQPLTFSNHSISIDPYFVRFDLVRSELSTIVLLCDAMNSLVWNSLTFVTFANVVINCHDYEYLNPKLAILLALATLVMVLFKLNYLNSSVTSIDYKKIILSDSLINMLMIIFTTVLITLSQKSRRVP